LSPSPARPSITIINTYFGQPPAWLPAFLRSCQANPDVRWLIYADFGAPGPTPPNVTFRPLALRQFNERASAAIGAPVSIEQANLRKVCDFKPIYGLMFADDLQGADFWAYSDLDVVWGDIRRFVTDDLLNAHIIVSPRQRKLGGHGTFVRNVEANNRIYQIVPDVLAVLTHPLYQRLDENILTHHLRELIAKSSFKARPKIYWQQEMTISAEYQKALLAGGTDWKMWWRSGRAFDAEGREVMYLHFHKLETCMRSIDFTYGDAPEAFSLSRLGIRAER
jgi:hypothetical protein